MVFLDSSRVLKGNKITIKADVAKKLKIKEGDKIIFEEEGGRIYIRKG